MEVATLVIAIIGAVTGVAALAWQVIMWKQGGPVVIVTATQAFFTLGPDISLRHSTPVR